MTEESPPSRTGPSSREWRVKYDGICDRCGRGLIKGTPAVWDRSTKTIRCIECPVPAATALVVSSDEQAAVDVGIAGVSASREYERRKAIRDAAARSKWGDTVGGWVVRLTAEPQSTRAWAIGAVGEEKLARALAGVPGIRMLHDRRVPGTRGNIDHLVVGPAGVFVVDAKHLKGLITIRNRGPFWRSDPGLFVGSRDCSKLAAGLAWQVDAVAQALAKAGIDPLPRITPVLCFVDGEWPLLRPPKEYSGVRLEGTRSIQRLLAEPAVLASQEIDALWRALGTTLPPK